MSDDLSPEYIDYFGYMLDNYQFPMKQSERERFYIDDIENN